MKLHFKKTQQVQLCIGWPGLSYFHKDIYALHLLSIILGGNMSSRLFVEIREKHGLAYFIRASANVYQDTGIFVIHAGLDKSRLDQAIKLILSEVGKIKKQGVTAKELKNAKDFLAGKIILELEDSENVASWYGKQELLIGKILTPQERLVKINRVKLGDIKRVANGVMLQQKLNLALIGPFKDGRKIENLNELLNC